MEWWKPLAGFCAFRWSLRRCLLTLLCFCFAGRLFAHDPGLSSVGVVLKGDRLEATVCFARKDVESVLAEGKSAGAEPVPLDQFEQLLPEVLMVEQENRLLDLTEGKARFSDADDVEFRLVFLTGTNGTLKARSPLMVRLPIGHRQFLSVTDAAGRLVTERLLSADEDTLEIEPRSGVRPSFSGFLALGVEHILTGYDHLLFLLALLIVTRTFRSAITIITCFTIAHSITLAVATLDLVPFPARIVESIIAASIVYVGVENILSGWGTRRLTPAGRRDAGAPGLRWRWALTFAFGLVHGFGFASVLRDLGVGADGGSIAVPLVSFNLGVELGQIAVAAVVLPVIWKFQSKPAFAVRWVPACSAAVVLAGGYWLVQRIYDL